MSTFVQEDKKGESGKPWIGFAVRSGKGRPGVYICDVVEDGPAYHAGLQEDDQLVSIGNVYCDSMKDFRAAMKVCKKPGKKVVITGRRGRDDEFRVNLKIGVKKRVIIEDVPSINSLAELRAVLKDPVKLKKITEASFAAADEDCSGLVTKAEYTNAMRKWLSPEAAAFISDEELNNTFEQCDTDGSGFLGLREFPNLVLVMLNDMLKNMNTASDSITATILGPEKPWLGFTVRKPRGQKQVFIHEVEEHSPASIAGLSSGDQIVSFGGVRITNLLKFHDYLDKRLRFALPLVVKFKRFGKVYTTKLVVGHKESIVYKNVRSSYTASQLDAIRNDSEAFTVVTEHLFQKLDEKSLGLVDTHQLLTVLRGWEPLDTHINEQVLAEILSLHDFDESGYINKAQFYDLFRSLLTVTFRWQDVSRSAPLYLRRQKHAFPVPTSKITQSWHAQGYLGGTFHVEGHRAWMRTTTRDHWPHIFVAVSDNLLIEKASGEPQRETLQPGDEIFIPAGTVYNVKVRDENASRFMFALCVNSGLGHGTLSLPFLQQEVQPVGKRHVGLGFRVATDPATKKLKVSWVSKDTDSGLQVGDTLVSIDSTAVATRKEFQSALKRCVVGQEVRVDVVQAATGESLVVYIPAQASRHNVHFSEDTAITSLESLDTLMGDKKKLKQFTQACFAGCDVSGSGVVDRSSFSTQLMQQLSVPEAMGGALPEEEVVKVFEKADVGHADYLTAAEFRKVMGKVLKTIRLKALAIEEQSQPPPPPVVEPVAEDSPVKDVKDLRKGKRKRVVRRKLVVGKPAAFRVKASKPAVKKTVVTTKRTGAGRGAVGVGQFQVKITRQTKVARSGLRGDSEGALSPWSTKKPKPRKAFGEQAELVTMRRISVTPRSKAAALGRFPAS
eukprot:EG_transcript_2668